MYLRFGIRDLSSFCEVALLDHAPGRTPRSARRCRSRSRRPGASPCSTSLLSYVSYWNFSTPNSALNVHVVGADVRAQLYMNSSFSTSRPGAGAAEWRPPLDGRRRRRGSRRSGACGCRRRTRPARAAVPVTPPGGRPEARRLPLVCDTRPQHLSRSRSATSTPPVPVSRARCRTLVVARGPGSPPLATHGDRIARPERPGLPAPPLVLSADHELAGKFGLDPYSVWSPR